MFHLPKNFILIFLLSLLAIYIDLPKNIRFSPEIHLNLGPFKFNRDLAIKEGLDLSGGTHLVLSADMKDVSAVNRDTALSSATEIISRRVNLYGVSEPIVQSSKSSGDYRILVELPGIKDINQALNLIGQTAQLEFREFKEASVSASPSAFLIPTIENTKSSRITGRDLQSARAEFDPQTGAPVVAFSMTDEGAKKFEELTKKLLNKPLAIFLDNIPVSWPTVNAVISKNGVISGNFTTAQTKQLSLQLNAGALPVPIKIIEQRNIGATLGKESVNKSLIAGVIGLIIVGFFMILNYGIMGILADMALLIYTILTLAVFKLVPVTVTLAGIAGFILSIGMAVDANILIFERMKEEERLGKSRKTAIDLGFSRAWSSIRDSNASSLITCGILYWFGTGLIRGFALTLGLGILISLFSAIYVTKTFLNLIYRDKPARINELTN